MLSVKFCIILLAASGWIVCSNVPMCRWWPGSAVQALVQGLETSVLYEFWMQAVTGAGRGQTTDVIRIITPSDSRPPGQPATLSYCFLITSPRLGVRNIAISVFTSVSVSIHISKTTSNSNACYVAKALLMTMQYVLTDLSTTSCLHVMGGCMPCAQSDSERGSMDFIHPEAKSIALFVTVLCHI